MRKNWDIFCNKVLKQMRNTIEVNYKRKFIKKIDMIWKFLNFNYKEMKKKIKYHKIYQIIILVPIFVENFYALILEKKRLSTKQI